VKQAAGILLHSPTGRILLLRRSALVSSPGTWNFPGGEVDPGETPKQAAIREVEEEAGVLFPSPRFIKTIVNPQTGTRYHLFAACTPPFVPHLNPESDGWTWVYPEEMVEMHLHAGLRDIDW